MTTISLSERRGVRDSAATRRALLEAARRRFVVHGYDQVGLRDIAADAGADAALVSRYFGTKEQLFTAVLATVQPGTNLMSGRRETFGSRVADALFGCQPQSDAIDSLLIVLRAIGSDTAMELLRAAGVTVFLEPLGAWIGGPDARVRAYLATSLIMGVAVNRELNGDLVREPDQRALITSLADMLQALVDGRPV